MVGRARIQVLELSSSLDRVDARILGSGDDRWQNPTTGAVGEDGFYFMANPGTEDGRILMMRLE